MRGAGEFVAIIQRRQFVGCDTGTRSGIAPNELTSLDDRDKFAGTPHHKFVPAKIEAVA